MTITSVSDGSSDKFYRAWADSADGSKGFSTTDSSKEYFGVYAGTTPPSNYKAYSWTKIKGEAGRSVVDTEMEYAINDSKTTPPTSGWSLEIPVWETGLYIWQRVKVSYSTGNPSYTTPHCLESNIIDDVTGNIGDWIFRDKTDKLSGTEIWTDKADEDAVVHVEIDGKSYQNAGSGKNLVHRNTFTGEVFKTSETTNAVDKVIEYNIPISPNSTYILSGIRPSNLGLNIFATTSKVNETITGHNSMYNHVVGGSIGIQTTDYKVPVGYNYVTITTGGSFQKSYHSVGASLTWSNIQLEEGSVPTEYELPAPTPDHPIEIHSLNDFDVVSSVGRENLALNSNKGWTSSVYKIMDGTMSEDWIVGETYTITIKGEVNAGNGFGIWRDAGGVRIPGSFVYNPETKTQSLTAVIPMPAVNAKIHNVFSIYNVLSANATSANIEWVKIEKGSFSTAYSLAPKDITESNSHPTIDKINLSLDEPLRSVGDAKDRLFRDSDGLWKVERNIGSIVFTENTSLTRSVNSAGNVLYWTRVDNKIYNSEYISTHYKWIDRLWSNVAEVNVMPENSSGFNPLIGALVDSTEFPTIPAYKEWLKNNNVSFFYQLLNPSIETLPSDIQDKLNNLRTFKDSNYIYTVLPDKSNILSENLKPNLHATFKSVAWANDFRYKFEQSKAMHSTDIWFAKGVSNTIAPNIGWSTDAPVWEDGLYIWSKTITTYGDGRTEETSPVCITGATGRSVDKIEEWYYLSNKPDSLEGGTWSKTPPTWTNGKYIWTKSKIIYKNPSGSEETLPINNTGGSGQKGDTGTDAKTVRLANVIHAVHFDQDGLMPSVNSIAFPTAVQGFSGVTPYYEFKMGSTIVRGLSTDSSWALNTSAMKYSDFPLAVTVNVVISGQTLATDTVTIVGTKPGEDAYTVVLANESHTFVGDVSNAIAGNTTANVIAYRGGTQVGATIGAISGLPAGMVSTIHSNGTTSARVTFTVTTSMKSPNGVVNIPVTVNGKSFTKVFNYAIAFKGAKGDKGTDGVAGKDGVGIKTTVLAYASSTSGTTTPTSGWATTVPTVAPGNYLWTRTTWTYTDNSVENGYTVSRIGKDGNTGKDGVAGKDGVGIKSTVIHYGRSTSGTSHSGVAWTTAVPSVPNGEFLWTRTTWTYDDNTTEAGYSVAKMGETGAKGATGPQGVSITKVDVQYYLSTSNTSLTGGSWSTTAPAWVDGRFMWSKTVTTYTSGSPTESKPVCITGAKGTTGSTGSTGATGRGVSSIVEQFYLSNSKDARTGGSWSTTMPTWSPGKYIWTRSLITYTTGTPATSTTEPLVSSEWEAINEIEIGGRNLVLNTKGKLYRTFGSGATLSEVNGATRLTWTGISQTSMGEKLSVPLITGETYTLSFEARGTLASPYIEIYILASSGGNLSISSSLSDTIVTQEFRKYTATFKFTGNPSYSLFIGGRGPAGTWLEVKDATVKLEKGNKATDWTPAPEDVEAAYTAVAEAKAEAERVKAEAYADGKVSDEEKARIADANAKLAAAKKHAENISKVQDIGNGDKKFINVGGLAAQPSSTSGYLVIKTPLTSSYMTKMKISGYNYMTGKTNIDISVSFYAYSSNTFYNYGFISSGNYTYGKVQLARDSSGRTVVIIGNQSDAYSYPKISIDEVLVTFGTPPDSFKDGFSAEIVTDISMYTSVVNVPGSDTQSQINKSVKSTDVEYYLSTSSTGLAGGKWQTTAPAWVNGRYMWSRTKVVLNDGTTSYNPNTTGTNITGAKGSTGSTGAAGKGVSSITEEYYLSDSKTSRVGGGWTTTAPTWSTGKYVWTRSKIVWNNPTDTTYTTPIVDNSWEAVNELEIGGTNLVGGSPSDWVTHSMAVGVWTATLTSHIKISDLGLKPGDTITLSMEIEAGALGAKARLELYKDESYRSQEFGNVIKNGRGVSYVTAVIPPDRPIIIVRLAPEITPVATAHTVKYRRFKVEKGNKATSWSPAPEDIQSQIDKSVKYTDVEYYLSTSNTGLAGGKWQTIAPIWTDGKYMWSRTKVVLNDGTTDYKPSTTGTNITGAKGATGSTGPKGNPGENATARNFLLESKPNSPITNSSYPIANFLLAEKPVVGETYTICIKGQLAATKTSFYAYNSGGSISVASSIVHQGNGLYYKSFNWINSYSSGVTANDTSVVIYPFTSSQSGTSTIEWITMVKGTVPLTEWVPAHEDIYQYVDDVEIGGANLLNNSDKTYSRELSVGNLNFREDNYTDLDLTTGDEYVFSVYLRADSTVNITNPIFLNSINRSSANAGAAITTTWKRFIYPIVWLGGSYNGVVFAPHIYHTTSGTGYIYAKRPQLEKGNKVTDWSPSAEDVAVNVNKKTYNPVRYIRDWSNGSTANTGNHWYELMAFDEYGNNRALGGTVTSNGNGSNFHHLTNGVTAIGTYVSAANTTGNPVYVQVDLGKIYYNITEIKVWKYYNDGRTYYENKTEVSSDGVTWYPIYDYTAEGNYTPTESGKTIPNTIAKTHSILTAEGTKNLIDQKADGSTTESALNDAAAKLQVLQQEVEAAATANELSDFIDKYNKDMQARDKATIESEGSLSSALTSITAIQNNLSDMSETWTFIDRFIKNTPQGIVVGNDSSGSYILIKEDRLSFYSNGQEVAFISQNLMEISRGAFVEQIQIAKYQFEESTTNHLTVRFVG